MSFSDFNKIVRNLNVSAEEICLVYAGEPYLHPKFFDMIKALSSKFYTSTITNGTLLDGERIEKTLKCGLDSLQISFDGFRRESYEKYRVGANFDGVKNNVLNLFAAKRKKKYGLPLITMTYLVNAYNQDEVDDCRRFFLVNGANRFFAKAINLNVHRRKDGKTEQDLIHWLPNQHDISLYHEDETGISFRERQGVCTTCLSPIIRTDGEILICCHDIFNSVKIGNIFEKDFYSIWFGEYYKKLRKLGKERKLPICQKCGK